MTLRINNCAAKLGWLDRVAQAHVPHARVDSAKVVRNARLLVPHAMNAIRWGTFEDQELVHEERTKQQDG